MKLSLLSLIKIINVYKIISKYAFDSIIAAYMVLFSKQYRNELDLYFILMKISDMKRLKIISVW